MGKKRFGQDYRMNRIIFGSSESSFWVFGLAFDLKLHLSKVEKEANGSSFRSEAIDQSHFVGLSSMPHRFQFQPYPVDPVILSNNSLG